ncbi:hypothetical protein FKP32DRAFT_980291 [Trametes sanguinea]|nr:hypothetical protein FKP32DRAFT_980291 [Trametes sanguinea]
MRTYLDVSATRPLQITHLGCPRLPAVHSDRKILWKYKQRIPESRQEGFWIASPRFATIRHGFKRILDVDQGIGHAWDIDVYASSTALRRHALAVGSVQGHAQRLHGHGAMKILASVAVDHGRPASSHSVNPRSVFLHNGVSAIANTRNWRHHDQSSNSCPSPDYDVRPSSTSRRHSPPH